jgi:eukaryotic-like serine/threonine-protein kinase
MVQRLGSYLLVERLNTGGMADIYLAKQFGFGGTDQIVALKCIRPEIAEDPVFIRMFVDEAKLAVLLRHGNIASTYELGCIGSTYCIAMEFIHGRDLRALIERARARGVQVPERLGLHIMAQICDGLDYAHRKADPVGVPLNIVHRDVSPQNMLLSYAGEVKVIDFGIAKAATHASRSQAGVLKGKYGYMSPEQVRGQSVDARSDIFACGVVLWELLTRERLFSGSSDFSVLEKVRQVEVIPPTLVSPSISPDVEAVIMRALERDPNDRYATASDMRDALLEIMLRRYGQASPRDLVALMVSLFEVEKQEEMGRLERARQFTEMPADAEALGEEASRSGGGDVELKPPEVAPVRETPAAVPTPARPSAAAPGSRAPGQILWPVVAQSTGSVPTRDLAPTAKTGSRSVAQRSPLVSDTPLMAAGGPAPNNSRRAAAGFPGDARPTDVRRVYRKAGRRRDWAIVAVAIGLALTLVLGTWFLTRPSAGNTRGGVIITTAPSDAQVLFDGVLVGSTPFSSAAIPPGVHDVTLEKSGFAVALESVKVVGNKVVELHVTLKPGP